MYLVTTVIHGYIPHHLSYSNFQAWKFVRYSTSDEQLFYSKNAGHELIFSSLAHTRLGLLALITVVKSQIRAITCLTHSTFHYSIPTPYDLFSLQKTQLNFELFEIF
jgi:hypothetical protein